MSPTKCASVASIDGGDSVGTGAVAMTFPSASAVSVFTPRRARTT
jgi:hypothetical protein